MMMMRRRMAWMRMRTACHMACRTCMGAACTVMSTAWMRMRTMTMMRRCLRTMRTKSRPWALAPCTCTTCMSRRLGAAAPVHEATGPLLGLLPAPPLTPPQAQEVQVQAVLAAEAQAQQKAEVATLQLLLLQQQHLRLAGPMHGPLGVRQPPRQHQVLEEAKEGVRGVGAPLPLLLQCWRPRPPSSSSTWGTSRCHPAAPCSRPSSSSRAAPPAVVEGPGEAVAGRRRGWMLRRRRKRSCWQL
mmetsp:Transcript_4813/g.13157  ORF Transcript_4813/g.13157 Transcript_4813/m.13157 type:complete len:243 (-) Transcript_4813:3180-3908(-)